MKLKHLFVRGDDPQFGEHFGGACVKEVDGVMCGWPELAHPDRVITVKTFWRRRMVSRRAMVVSRRAFIWLTVLGASGAVLALAGFSLKLVWFFLKYRAGCAG